MSTKTLAHGVAPAGFLAELEGLPPGRIAREAAGRPPAGLETLDPGTPPGLGAVAALLSGRDIPTEDLLREARARTDRGFGRCVLLYAPCYLSSHCVNLCRYCGFNYGMPIPRIHLSRDQAMREMRLLADRGLRRILLVAGEYPALAGPGYVAGIVEAAASLVPEIDLEVGPAPVRTYRRWVQAGAGGVVCYQETYDRDQYLDMHPRGPKRSYEFRLGTAERAAAAGMKRLGIGILLGLAEPVADLVALVAHARYLARRFPGVSLTASLPRLRPAVAGFRAPFPVDDEALVRYYAVARIALPDVGLVVSTREQAAMRQTLLGAGVTQMSAESVTVPGGYGEQRHDGGQFDVADHRPVAEVAGDLEDRGYTVRLTGAGAPALPGRAPEA